LKFTPETSGEFYLCQCKETKTPPYCDGSHKCGLDRNFIRDRKNIIRDAVLNIGLGREKKILDVGCGDGEITTRIAPFASQIVGIDPSEELISIAKSRKIATNTSFDVGVGEKLSYPDGQFDVVVFLESLHHVQSPKAALEEASRVLINGGVLLVIEPIFLGGTLEEIVAIYNNEQEVREAAERAVTLAPSLLPLTLTTEFCVQVDYLVRDVESFIKYEVKAKRWNKWDETMRSRVSEMVEIAPRAANGAILLTERLKGWLFTRQ